MKKEVWKEYPLDFGQEGDYRMEVSNFGQVKTYNNLHPEGKIIGGGKQAGFPIIRIKLFKKKTEAEQKKIAAIQQEIDQRNLKIKDYGSNSETLDEKKKLQKERDALIQKRKEANRKINNRRSINIAILVHKAVAELFLEKPESKEKLFIIHIDFDKENNHVTNLRYATQDELTERSTKHPKNVLYAFKKQFLDQKPNTSSAKLTETEVLTIKKRLKKGYTLKRLAKQFNVSDMQIHRIKTGENWSHVKLLEDIIEEKDQ